MYLLDTDTLSHWHAGNQRLADRIRQVDDPEIVISVVTKIEILRGRYDFVLKAADATQLLKAQFWLDRSEELFRPLTILPVDKASAELFDRLKHNRKLRNIGRADLLIASIALAHRATLVTRNVRHFAVIPNLRVANWVD
jgi:tRNA(fMet)-specific endonuclease VapC